jgi:prepilin-type N-terminal cleavage/methylation domain-containing protein
MNRGMTLIETLAAITILSIAIVALDPVVSATTE